MEEHSSAGAPSGLAPLGRKRAAVAVRMGRSLAGPYSAPGWMREGCYVLAALTVLVGPPSPATFAAFAVLLALGSVLTRRFFRRVMLLAPYGAALQDAFGDEGSALVLAEMDRSPRTDSPLEDLRGALTRVLSQPVQRDCSLGHVPGCVHRSLLQRPPSQWWPADFTALVTSGRGPA